MKNVGNCTARTHLYIHLLFHHSVDNEIQGYNGDSLQNLASTKKTLEPAQLPRCFQLASVYYAGVYRTLVIKMENIQPIHPILAAYFHVHAGSIVKNP